MLALLRTPKMPAKALPKAAANLATNMAKFGKLHEFGIHVIRLDEKTRSRMVIGAENIRRVMAPKYLGAARFLPAHEEHLKSVNMLASLQEWPGSSELACPYDEWQLPQLP